MASKFATPCTLRPGRHAPPLVTPLELNQTFDYKRIVSRAIFCCKLIQFFSLANFGDLQVISRAFLIFYAVILANFVANFFSAAQTSNFPI